METKTINQNSAPVVTKKNKKKQILSLILILASIVLVVFVVWSNLKNDVDETTTLAFSTVFNTWMDNWPYLIITFSLFIVAMLAEAMKYFLMIFKKTGTRNFRISVKTMIIGKYYDSITPLASGGQPFQIIYLKKAGLTAGQAAALPIISFFLSRLAFVVLCVASFILVPLSMVENHIKIMAFVGAVVTIIAPLIIILLSFFPNTIIKLLHGCINGLAKIKLIRNKEKTKSNLDNMVTSYCESIKEFKDAKITLVCCLFLSIITQLALTSIPYFVILSSLNSGSAIDVNYVFCVALGFFANASVTFSPTPGMAGAAEYSFSVIFGQFITGGYLVYGMLFWRFITFYLMIVIGLAMVIVDNINKKKAVKIKQKIESVIDKVDDETNTDVFSVALFNDNYYPIVDGVVKVVDNYAIELSKKQIKTTVIVPTNKGYVDKKDVFEVIRVPSMRVLKIEYPMARPNRSKQSKELLKAGDIAIYHAHSPFTMGHYALRMAKKHRVPLVATFHSKYYDDFLARSKSKLVARLGVRYIVNFLNQCDAVWTVSETTADTLRSYGYKGNITIMPNGTNFVEPKQPQQLIKSAKTAYNIKKNDRVLLFVGHLIWQKNLKLILDTFAVLRKNDARYKLLLVGEGGNEKAVKAYAEKHGLIDNGVQFLGKISEMEQLQGIYGAANLFFFPSTYDTFGIVVCEAATMKIPSLLVKGSNAAENIIDNDNGYLAENNIEAMAKRINEIFEDEHLMKKTGEKAYTTLPNSWTNIASKVRNEYRKIMKDYYEKESN